MKTHIILIGFMGTGKTTIGTKLAEKLNIYHVDTDETMEEEMQCTIATYFQEFGEGSFRQKETEVLNQVLNLTEPTVITTGGGIVLRPENRTLMQKHGWVVALEAPPAEIVSRLRNDTTRPLLQNGKLEERVELLYQERQPYYQFADITIDSSIYSVDEIVEQLVDLWFNFTQKR